MLLALRLLYESQGSTSTQSAGGITRPLVRRRVVPDHRPLELAAIPEGLDDLDALELVMFLIGNPIDLN